MENNFEKYLENKGVDITTDVKPVDLAKHVAGFVKEGMAQKADLDQYKDLQKAVQEAVSKNTELEDKLKAQGIELAKQRELSKHGQDKKEALKSSRSMITEKVSDIVKSHKSGGSDIFLGDHRKDTAQKADTTTGSIANNARAFDLEGIGQLGTRRLTALDFFTRNSGIIPPSADGKVRYIDWDDATKVRSAAMMAEGGTFPESTAAWDTYSLSLKKVGDSLPWTDEFEYDAQFLVNELSRFLMINVDLIIDNQIINGDGLTNNLTGLFTSVPAYTPVASGITDASIYDLFVKVSEVITASYGSKGNPDFAVMNIVDINKYRLKKDDNNNYVMPPFVTADGNVIAGMQVIESNAVTANSMVIGDSSRTSVYGVPGVGIETGYINTDFTDGKKRMRMYRRILFLIREADKTSFLKVTDIDAALVTLAS